jgi:hypothetical protein
MPRGGARPGAGRPRKSLATHVLRGTYRPDRHGPRPSNVVALPAPVADWMPAQSDMIGLGARARDWLDATLTTHRLDALEGAHVLLALRCLDRLDQLERGLSAATGATAAGEPHPLLPAIAREARTFASLWAGLRLGGRD